MKEQLKAVEEFHKVFKQSYNEFPMLILEEEAELRHRLLQEELDEYLNAAKEGNMLEIADALGDQLYILYGTIIKHGMQHIITDVFNEIHRSNMSKLGPDGEPILREDGKILKGPDYTKPDILGIMLPF
jgi:predicted HAD superfamily Cof-like phosphohydrolase